MRFSRFALAFVLLAVTAVAQTYYVDSSSSRGGMGAGTKGNPFASPLDVPLTGDADQVVIIARGTKYTLSSPWHIPARVTVKAGGSPSRGLPILDGANAYLYGLITVTDPVDVRISDLILERSRHGMLIEGNARNCVIERVTARDMYGFGGFAHEDATDGEGRVTYIDCTALRCEGDGFSNRGNARDHMIRCRALFCGPIWSAYELSDKIPEGNPDGYTSVAITRPTIRRNVYVDSVNGADTNDGLSKGSAWATLDKVETSSLASDRINVARGSSFTASGDAGTLTMKSNQEIVAYGSGPRPIFGTINNEALVVDGVSNVVIEGLYFINSSPGVEISGTVSNIWVIDCLFSRCDTRAVESNDTDGTGDVNIFKCGFFWNEDGGVWFDQGGYTVNAWSCRGSDNGYTLDTTAVAAWKTADTSTMNLYDVQEFDPNYRGFAFENTTGNNFVFGCYVAGPMVADVLPQQIGIDVASGGTTEIANTVIVLENPATGDDTVGIKCTDGTVKVFYNTIQGLRTTGGNGEVQLSLGSGIDSADIRGNIFENATGNADTYYISLDATATGIFTIDYNAYHSWSNPATDQCWYDTDGTTGMTFTTFVAIDGVDEETGSPTTGKFPTNQITTNLGADVLPSDARIDDAHTETSGGNAEIIGFGIDLYAAGVVTWNTDGGLRTRGKTQNGGWTNGAFENNTGSPDGYTTHTTSGMLLEDCEAIYCQNGCDFTHDAEIPESEMAVLRSTFDNCYDGAFERLLRRSFPIRDCVFTNNTQADLDILPPAASDGDTWEITGNYFYGCSASAAIQLRSSSSAITYNFFGNVMVSSETHWWPRPGIDMDEMIRASAGSNTLNIHNNAFVLRDDPNGLRDRNIIETDSSAPTINAQSNIFLIPDDADAFFFKLDNVANIGTINRNFYSLNSSNLDNWYSGSAINFAAWQALTGTPDVNGQHSAARIAPWPALNDPRMFPADSFRVAATATQIDDGSDLGDAYRRSFGGVYRSASASWSFGPFAAPVTNETMHRTSTMLVFADHTLAGAQQNLHIAPPGSIKPDERVVIEQVSLRDKGGSDLEVFIHDGYLANGDILWCDFANSSEAATTSSEFFGSWGRDVRVSFGTTGSVYGFIKYRVISAGSEVDQAEKETTRAGN